MRMIRILGVEVLGRQLQGCPGRAELETVVDKLHTGVERHPAEGCSRPEDDALPPAGTWQFPSLMLSFAIARRSSSLPETLCRDADGNCNAHAAICRSKVVPLGG